MHAPFSPSLVKTLAKALAQVDLSKLTHAQRTEALAKAAGYASYGALKAQNTTNTPAPAPTSTPSVRAVVAYGHTLCDALGDEAPFRDRHGHIDGEVREVSFASQAEIEAYEQGLLDADGWMGTAVVTSSAHTPAHPFFQAKAAAPDLTFEDWYHQAFAPEEPAVIDTKLDADLQDMVALMHAADRHLTERMRERAHAAVIGYQVYDFEGEPWGDRPTFEILTYEDALRDMRAALDSGSRAYRMVMIRDQDVENPTFG